MEQQRCLRSNELRGLHLLRPHPIVSGNNKLSIRKVIHQQLAELTPMISIDRHDNIVQKRECESVTKQSLHQRQVQTDTHAVLVPFTVVGPWRVQATLIKIDVKIE